MSMFTQQKGSYNNYALCTHMYVRMYSRTASCLYCVQNKLTTLWELMTTKQLTLMCLQPPNSHPLQRSLMLKMDGDGHVHKDSTWKQHSQSFHHSQPGLMSTLAPQTVGSSQDSRMLQNTSALVYIVVHSQNPMYTQYFGNKLNICMQHTYTLTHIHIHKHTHRYTHIYMVSNHFTEPFLPLSQSLHPQSMRSCITHR